MHKPTCVHTKIHLPFVGERNQRVDKLQRTEVKCTWNDYSRCRFAYPRWHFKWIRQPLRRDKNKHFAHTLRSPAPQWPNPSVIPLISLNVTVESSRQPFANNSKRFNQLLNWNALVSSSFADLFVDYNRTLNGKWVCSISHKMTPLTTILTIGVLTMASCVSPFSHPMPGEQAFAMEPQDQVAVVGTRVILPCRVLHKKGVLQWTKDDFGLGTHRKLPAFERYSMIGSDDEGDYSLQIFPVTLDDEARYQCQVGPDHNGKFVH